MDFMTMMALEPHGTDVWVGSGPRYPWGGLYGGQIVAQGLRAAMATVDPDFKVHSLHAYFIRLGDHTEPIRFEVDRVRNGRSFLTRRVVARQSVGVILNMSASFQRDEPGVQVQTAKMPDLAPPDKLAADSWTPMFARHSAARTTPGQAAAWMKLDTEVGDDPMLQACALAYLSDDLPTDAAVSLHPDGITSDQFYDSFFSASLDHAIWFHRPMSADEWHVQSFTCLGLMGTRGVSLGHVFAADGTQVATISQEVLLRRKR